MKNKKGFTLIEILAVIIIIGIIMIIAVPAVTKYIFKSNKSVYASDVSAFVESVRAEYEMKEYGTLLKDDEIMIVPIRHITFEKGDSKSSPYGEYDLNKSYVLIVPERNAYSYYATVIDSENIGLVRVRENEIGEDLVEEGVSSNLPSLDVFNNPSTIYDFNGRAYRRIDVRTIDNGGSDDQTRIYVFRDTGVLEQVKVIQLFSHLGPAGVLDFYYDSWRFNGEVVNSVAKPVKVGYTFKGYYTGLNGNGKKVINEDATIVEDIDEELGMYTVAYAHFKPNELIFNNVSRSINFSYNDQQVTIPAATNGTGNYTYTELQEINEQGNATNYMRLNGTTITVAGNTPVGTYTYRVHVKDDVSGSEKEAAVTIGIGRVLATLACKDREYNGTNQNLYTDSTGCTSVTNGTQKNAGGPWTLTCVPDNNHLAPATCTAKMKQKALTIKAKDQTINYGGSIATGVNQVTVTGLVNGDSLTAVTLTPSTSSATTNGTITPSAATTTKGITNYSVTYQTGVLKINRIAGSFSCSNKTFDGTNQTACTCSGGTLSGTTAATNYSSTPYEAYCTPDGNHTINGSTGKQTIKWTMARRALTITAKAQTINYGSGIATGVNQVTVSGLVSGDNLTGITLTASTSNATTSGKITPSAATTTKGSGNYDITYKQGALTINRVAGSFTCTDQTYDGTNRTACTCSGGTLSGTTAATNYQATAYTAYCTPDGNHTINGSTAKQTLTWKMKQKALTIKAKDQTINYGGSIATGVNQVTVSGLVSGDSLTAITLTASTSSATTNGTITPKSGTTTKGIGNYSVTYQTGVLKINKVSATLTCKDREYNGNNQNLYTNSTGCTSVTNGTQKNAGGPWTLTCVPDGNHTAPSTCTAKMTKKAATMSLNKSSATLTYPGTTTATITSTGDGSITCSSNNTNVATCSVSGSTLTIASKPNTADGKTATITVTRNAGTNYGSKSATISVTVNRGTLTCPGNATKNVTYNTQTQSYAGNNCPSGSTSSNASGVNVGTYYGSCTANSGYKFSSSCTKATLKIGKANGYVNLNSGSGSISCSGTTTFSVSSHHGGSLSCSSSNTGVATCSMSGSTVTVRGVGAGSATITVSSGATGNYNAASKGYSISVSNCYVWYNSCTNYNWDCTHDCGPGPCNWRCEYHFGKAPLEVRCGNPGGYNQTSNWPWNGYCWCKYASGTSLKTYTCDTSTHTVQC